jgi:hypothetical protein
LFVLNIHGDTLLNNVDLLDILLQKAAQESKALIQEAVAGSDMVFITVCAHLIN